MPFPNAISTDKLLRLIGTAKTPALIDVRPEEDFAADARLIPGAIRRNHHEVIEWGSELAGAFGDRHLPARPAFGTRHSRLAPKCRRQGRGVRRWI